MKKSRCMLPYFLNIKRCLPAFNPRWHKTGNIKTFIFFDRCSIYSVDSLYKFYKSDYRTSCRTSKRSRYPKSGGCIENCNYSKQFIGESIILCLIAFILTSFFWLLLPLFNQLAGKTISHGIFENPVILSATFLSGCSHRFLAGIYPALYLSSFKPVTVLKGRFATGTGAFI